MLKFSNYLEIIKDKMNDPGSAQFRNLKMNGYAVCGEFNGKNKFGGYVGYKKFFFVNGGYAVIEGEHESLNGYVRYKLESENEVLEELIYRKKNGDKRKYSDNEIKEIVGQRTFDRVYNNVCAELATNKTDDTGNKVRVQ